MQSESDHALLSEIRRSLTEPEFELSFSLKWLFFGMTAVAIGFAMIVWAYDAGNFLFLIACWLGGGTLIGAGVLGLFGALFRIKYGCQTPAQFISGRYVCSSSLKYIFWRPSSPQNGQWKLASLKLRRLLNIASIVCLILCVALMGMWVRSDRWIDELQGCFTICYGFAIIHSRGQRMKGEVS